MTAIGGPGPGSRWRRRSDWRPSRISVASRARESPDAVWKRAEDDFKAGRYDQAEAGLGRLRDSDRRAPSTGP